MRVFKKIIEKRTYVSKEEVYPLSSFFFSLFSFFFLRPPYLKDSKIYSSFSYNNKNFESNLGDSFISLIYLKRKRKI